MIAGTTGKIVGVVTDASNGQPLAGVNVIVEGTTMGAATNTEGYYIILNIPPGLYTLRFSMMGYKEMRVENVRVQIDLTSTVNAVLEMTMLDLGETVTIVAERPLVQMDMTSSLSAVGAHEIRDLPVQEVSDVVELQAGIVEHQGNLHIRGGRSGEIAYWVDGVTTTDVFDGSMGLRVENSAVQELQVVSGTFNAEYGQAMSGIINIITKEGGKNYHGQIKGYVGDYFSNDDLYSVLNSVADIQDTLMNKTTVREQTENPVKERFNPIYDLEMSLSGPVPFTKNKLSFFTTGRYFKDDGFLYGRNWFTPQGLPGDSALVPMDAVERKSAQFKLTYNAFSNLKVSYNVFWNDFNRDIYWFDRNYRYNPGGLPKGLGSSNSHIFTLNHVLSPKTFYEFRLNRFYSEQESYVYENPDARPHWMVRVAGDSVTAERIIDLATEEGMAEFEQVKQLGRNYEFFIDPQNAEGYVHPDSSKAPAAWSYYRSGNDLNHNYRSTAYWIAKFDLTSQFAKAHQIKLGAEFRFYELALDSYLLRAKQYEGREEQIVPFVPDIPPVSSIYHDKYNRKPKEFSAYAQDKVEFKDMIVNIGLRFDYFDANSVIPEDPTDPNIYDPFKNEHIYKNWRDYPDTVVTPIQKEAWEKQFEKYTPEERRKFMQKKVRPKMQLSPRLGIAYPITDRGVIHFSYGHFFQIPEFQYLYNVPDFKLFSGGGTSILGNADLKAQRTVQYEIGFSQELTENIGMDVTLFYRDVRDWVGTSPRVKTFRPVVSYVKYENKDYENVRGITFKLEKRMSHNFSSRVDYSYQVAEGSYSNPNDAYFALQALREPRINLIPLNWDQRHTLNAQLIYQFKGFTTSFIGKLYSGKPYTPAFTKGAYVGGSALTGLPENSSRKPTISSVDLYLTRVINIKNFTVSAFLYVYNLFDQRGELNVFNDTGTATYTTDPTIDEVPHDPSRIGTVYDIFTRRPDWYIKPREMQLGLTFEF